MDNIFSDIPDSLPDELVEIIAENDTVRIERIVSRGHTSPDDFWYDQEHTEFVLLVSGEATLRIEDRDDPIRLKTGDYLVIPAHRKHRVEWTSPDEDTVWLAVLY
jgi:cupin 2 domain-containing protein